MKAACFSATFLLLSIACAQAQEPPSDKVAMAARCAAAQLKQQPGVLSTRWHASGAAGPQTYLKLRAYRGEIAMSFVSRHYSITIPNTDPQRARVTKITEAILFSASLAGRDARIALKPYEALLAAECQVQPNTSDYVDSSGGVRTPSSPPIPH
jgi:hypothetical protein